MKSKAQQPLYGIRYTSGSMQGMWIVPLPGEAFRNQHDAAFPFKRRQAAQNFLRNYSHRIKHATEIVTQADYIAQQEAMRKRFQTTGKP